jgi:hypothetical protein
VRIVAENRHYFVVWRASFDPWLEYDFGTAVVGQIESPHRRSKITCRAIFYHLSFYFIIIESVEICLRAQDHISAII